MTPDQQRVLVACLAAHIRRNTAGNVLVLSEEDVKQAYAEEPQFRFKADRGTVRLEVIGKA